MPGSFKAEAAQSKHYATGMRTVLFDMGVEKMVPIYCFLSIAYFSETSEGF